MVQGPGIWTFALQHCIGSLGRQCDLMGREYELVGDLVDWESEIYAWLSC